MNEAARIVSTLLIGLFLGIASPPAHARKPPAAAIDAGTLSAITRDLAADAFAGRAPGGPGEARTIDYLVERFRALGLAPGGAGGGWTQQVPLLRTRVDQSVPLVLRDTAGERKLAQGVDLYVGTQRDTDRALIEGAPLVFVGYGVSAPERQWDDYKGIDLTGKIAVFLVNDPDFDASPVDPVHSRFGDRRMTYYGRWTYKFEEAARRGAVAALIVHETKAAGYGWNTVIAPQGENFELARRDSTLRLALQGWLSGAAAQRLFADAGLELAALRAAARRTDFRAIELERLRLEADVPVARERVMSHNVLARLTGRKRPDETVVFGAHWDAYGIGGKPDAQGRTIRPGALDDAVGVAGVLEIARAFKAGPRPDRTIVFGLWTAEERGLLGSEQFMASGLYDPAKMAANLTLDTLQAAGLSRDVVLIGQGQSSLEAFLAEAAARQGRTVTPDANPERGLYFRADHFSFAKRGVPSLLFMALGGGVDLVEGGRARGDAWVSDFTARCYHQACDEWSPAWDLRGAAQDVELAFDIGRRVARENVWPAWLDGSEFRNLRGDR